MLYELNSAVMILSVFGNKRLCFAGCMEDVVVEVKLLLNLLESAKWQLSEVAEVMYLCLSLSLS